MEIRSIKDWCTALNEQSTTMEQYEKTLYAFYNSLRLKPDYTTPFVSGCYKREKFGKCVFGTIIKSLLPAAISAAVIGGIFWFVNMLKGPYSFTTNISANGSKYGTIAFIIGFVIFALVVGLSVLFKNLAYKAKIKTLDNIESNIKGFISTVPSNYRTSEKMKLIAKVYFNKPDIDPKDIMAVCEDYLYNNGHYSKFESVMFDVPCECPFLNISDSTSGVVDTPIYTDSKEKEKAEKRSPYLPKDIDNKVYEGSKDSDKDLANMIGLESVKDQIHKMKQRIEFYGKQSNNGNHMAFMGSAGTGKTTVARIVTKILFDLGYIEKNQYLEISGDYLCAGDTNRAAAILEYAHGGVLFIDEAYYMYRQGGSDIVGVLLKEMEDNRDKMVCILAGYEEQMTKLFASNEGFSSRIKHNIYFTDYTEDEMVEIFNYFLNNYNGKKYTLDPNAVDTLKAAFTLEKKAKSFGNARTVRNAVDAIMDYYADRCINNKASNKNVDVEDIKLYMEDRKKFIQHEMKNASAANQVDEQIIRLSELKPRLKNGSEDPTTDLAYMIGLDSFRKEIDSLKNQKEFYGEAIHQNILLLGEDGCGKSSVTKILTGFLYELGYIEENKYLEIPAEFLKGSFVGHTAKRAEAIISYATGGVLYIKNYNGLIDSEDSFAGEAISAITTALNENKNVTIVIADNPSEAIDNIRNMFTLVYEFPTYTDDQVLQIFDMLSNKDNFYVVDDARNALYAYICSTHAKIRDVQQIYTNTVKKHISNLGTLDVEDEKKYTIVYEDLALPEYTYSAPTSEPSNEDITQALNEIYTEAVEAIAENMEGDMPELIPNKDLIIQIDNADEPASKPVKIKLNLKQK